MTSSTLWSMIRRQKTAMSQFTRDFAARLRSLRQQRGWTQAELGRRLETDGAVLRSYELGRHHPPLVTLRKLSLIFGVSVDFLLNGEDKPGEGFNDRELLKLFLKADHLHYTRKDALKQVIEAFLAAEQLAKTG